MSQAVTFTEPVIDHAARNARCGASDAAAILGVSPYSTPWEIWATNLSNLRWDTVIANHADKLLHGTDQRGERNPRARLSELQVAEIRARYATEATTLKSLAAEYGVTFGHIHKIVKGLVWANQ